MASTYQDFIPADQDAGALGNGFADFVPPKAPVKPTPHEDEVIIPETIPPKPRDEKGHFVK